MVEQSGDHRTDVLLSDLYHELRQLAQKRLSKEMPGQTLTPTALVHETYLRICVRGGQKKLKWDSTAHFFGAASEAMRRILIDNARRKLTVRHGGRYRRIDMMTSEVSLVMDVERARNLLDLDESLREFEIGYPKEAKLVKLRFFGGLTMEEAAKVIGITRRTAQRHWAFAKAYLCQSMASDTETSEV